jgi:hypothetical protein
MYAVKPDMKTVATPLLKQIEKGLKDVEAAKAGKAKLSPARDLIVKK